MDAAEAWRLYERAEPLHGPEAISQALDRLAETISAELGEQFPVVLALMSGALIFAGQLLPRLKFPLEVDYLHATRYRDGTRGGDIEWCALPRKDLAGRTVLVLDDILDEGHTLAAVRKKILELGAVRVDIAVMSEKQLPQAKPVRADYVGLTLPDRYVFGMGMDAYGLWRNLPAIYALKEE